MNELTAVKGKAIYEKHLEEEGFKSGTIRWKLHGVDLFTGYLKNEMDLRDVEKELIKGFAGYLETYISPRTGKALARRTRKMMFMAVKHLFGCLYRLGYILNNPAQGVRYKPRGVVTKRGVLDKKEMNRFLDSIDITKKGGLQERCVFELMYSSALRTCEVRKLNTGDIDFLSRLLLVRETKWDKDRVVPVNEVAILFLKKHLAGRMERREEAVFHGEEGRLGVNWVNKQFKKRLQELGIYRKGLTAHSIRHSASVHLLSNGADMRYVQELLGHESLETTAGYTNELYENLKRIYKSHHPRENEYYVEVDKAYREELEVFYQKLKRRKERTCKRRKSSRKWYEKHKKGLGKEKK